MDEVELGLLVQLTDVVLDEKKAQYFLTIQAGLDNYEPMKAIFRQVLHETQKNAGG